MKRHLILLASAVAAMACVSCGNQVESGELSELGADPQTGVWYKVTPEGAVTSKGEQWEGFFRKGTENKLIVYFYGGGVSVDEYSAARGFSVCPQDMFYTDDLGGDDYKTFRGMLDSGIASTDDANPFKDWTIVSLPYTTGDFHCGTGEFEYTSLAGERKILYHHGYTNFTKFMDMVVPYLGTPEALLITGSSAGGFGTSILSSDVCGYFPETQNVTSVVDASLLICDNVKQVAQDVWKAPQHIVDRIEGDNLTLDNLKALHSERPYVKIMFGVSKRDETLTFFNHYFVDGTRPVCTEADGEAFQQTIKKMATDMQESLPEAGLNIWEYGTANELGLTKHTIEADPLFLKDCTGNGSYADWIMNAVNGKVEKLGLELLD